MLSTPRISTLLERGVDAALFDVELAVVLDEFGLPHHYPQCPSYRGRPVVAWTLRRLDAELVCSYCRQSHRRDVLAGTCRGAVLLLDAAQARHKLVGVGAGGGDDWGTLGEAVAYQRLLRDLAYLSYSLVLSDLALAYVEELRCAVADTRSQLALNVSGWGRATLLAGLAAHDGARQLDASQRVTQTWLAYRMCSALLVSGDWKTAERVVQERAAQLVQQFSSTWTSWRTRLAEAEPAVAAGTHHLLVLLDARPLLTQLWSGSVAQMLAPAFLHEEMTSDSVGGVVPAAVAVGIVNIASTWIGSHRVIDFGPVDEAFPRARLDALFLLLRQPLKLSDEAVFDLSGALFNTHDSVALS